MLRRKPKKKSGLGSLNQTISLLSKNVGGKLAIDSAMEKELGDRNKRESETNTFARLRLKGEKICHSKVVLMVVVMLCMIDCVLVIGELILDMHAMKALGSSDHDANDHTACTEDVVYFYDYDTGKGGPVPKSELVHKKVHKHSLEEKLAHYFHYASITILLILFIETVFKIICLGSHFLTKKFEVFDALVVALSLVLDLVFIQGTTSRSIQESSYILSFILPWRVIRVVNSMIVALFDHEHIKLLMMFKTKKSLTKHIDDLSDDLVCCQKQLGALKKLVKDNEISDDKMNSLFDKMVTDDKLRKMSIHNLVSMGLCAPSNKNGAGSKVTHSGQSRMNSIVEDTLNKTDDSQASPLLNGSDSHVIDFANTQIDNTVELDEGNRTNLQGNDVVMPLLSDSDSSDGEDFYSDARSRLSVQLSGPPLKIITNRDIDREIF